MTTREISEAANLTENANALLREDSTPSAFLDSLQEHGLYEDAVRFLAHHLAIGAGIKWAVASVRELQPPDQKDRNEALDAADQWIKTPSDPARRAAKSAVDRAKDTSAGELAALAVFMSGGSITPPESPDVYPPPYAAHKMVAGSVRVAVVTHDPQHVADRYRRALAIGREAKA
jgi:hypothetical protein